ncbi:hypothetical protein AAAC51_40800 [Priestia megaterium]
MAEWLMNGAPTVDLELCDINRFDTYACSPVYYKQRSIEEYEEVYSIHHPFMQRKVSRNMRVSPFYMRQQELKAYFNEKQGGSSHSGMKLTIRLYPHMKRGWL